MGEEAFSSSWELVTPFTNTCDLTLATGQTVGDPDVAKKTWANMTWKSITLSGSE